MKMNVWIIWEVVSGHCWSDYNRILNVPSLNFDGWHNNIVFYQDDDDDDENDDEYDDDDDDDD